MNPKLKFVISHIKTPKDGTALRYAGEFMRQDRRFVLEALRQEAPDSKGQEIGGLPRLTLVARINTKVKMPQPCHMCQRRDFVKLSQVDCCLEICGKSI